MSRVILEYDSAVAKLTDSEGMVIMLGKTIAPFKPKPMEWLGTETMGPVKPIDGMGKEVEPPKPTSPPRSSTPSRAERFLKLALELRDSGFSHDQIILLKIHGIL